MAKAYRLRVGRGGPGGTTWTQTWLEAVSQSDIFDIATGNALVPTTSLTPSLSLTPGA